MSGSEPVFVRPSGRRKASVYRAECKVERKGTAVWKKVEGDGGGKRDSEPKARQPGFTLSRLKNARNVEENYAGGVPPRCDVDQLNRDAENLWLGASARSLARIPHAAITLLQANAFTCSAVVVGLFNFAVPLDGCPILARINDELLARERERDRSGKSMVSALRTCPYGCHPGGFISRNAASDDDASSNNVVRTPLTDYVCLHLFAPHREASL